MLSRRSLGEILYVALPKLANGAAMLLVNLLLLRHFGPEEFGAYSLAVAAVLLADAIFGSAIDMGVLRLAPVYRSSDRERSVSVERAGVSFKLALAAAALLLLVPLAEPIARRFLHSEERAHLVFLAAGAAAALLLLRSAQVHLQIEGRFRLYGILDALHFGLKFGGIALLVLLGEARSAPVLLCFCLGPLVALASFAVTGGAESLRWRRSDASSLRELLGFVKWFLPTFCLASLLARVDLFLLSVWRSLEEVGILSAAYVLALGFELLGGYLAVVYSPRVMPLCREGRFRDFYRRFQAGILAGSLALFAAAASGIAVLGPILLPESFSGAATVFLIALPGALGAFATFPVTLAFVMFVRPRFIFALDLLSVPLLLLGYAWAIPRHGALGAAVVTSAGRLLKSLVIQVSAWRWASELDFRPSAERGSLPGSMAESLSMGGAS